MRKELQIAFGGMWVFPGGKVDDEDWDGANEDVDAARNAAIREAAEGHTWVEAHEMVVFVTGSAGDRAEAYATWFFAAPVEDDDVIIDDGEIIDMEWTTPAAALTRHHEGEIEIVPPTWVTLDTLTGHSNVASLLAFLDARPARHYATRVARGAEPPVVMWEGVAGYDGGDASRAAASASPWPPTAMSTKTTESPHDHDHHRPHRRRGRRTSRRWSGQQCPRRAGPLAGSDHPGQRSHPGQRHHQHPLRPDLDCRLPGRRPSPVSSPPTR